MYMISLGIFRVHQDILLYIETKGEFAMNDKEKRPLPVDPVDGTRVYMPLGRRFSVGEELGEVGFEDQGEEDQISEVEDVLG